MLWDVSGKEKYKIIVKRCCKNSCLIIFVYDINNEESFNNIKNWFKDVKGEIEKNTKFLLVGNKCDVTEKERKVKKEEANSYAIENKMNFIEVSAFEGSFFDFSTKSQNNIEKMLDNSLEKILEDMKQIEDNNMKFGKFKNVNTENISLNKQNTTNIKNSFCNKYCSCCPCLKETEEKC